MTSAAINFDLVARDRASDKFQKFGRAADQTGSKVSKLGKVAKVGLAALGGGAVLAGVGLFKMGQAAAEDQKSQLRLAQQLKNTTGANKQQIASVEDWITAQGKALGVADDDLRPALGQLATATGDVGKSQKLASLAMDVSAGTGKKLSAVSQALAKAYTGNVGGLSRLGIATKDASGHTKTFAQLQQELGQKFKGQASTAANTFEGKLGRLKLALSEAGESIGYRLLPLAEKLATWFVGKGLPAIDKFSGIIQSKVGPAVQALIQGFRDGTGVGGKLASAFDTVSGILVKTFGWIANNKATVATFAGVLGTVAVATKTWAVIQAVLNAELWANPIGLVVIGLAGLAAGLVYAYKHSEKFRAITTAAFSAVKVIASSVAGFFTNQVPAAFSKVKNAAMTVKNWIGSNWPLLLGILTGPFGLAAVLIARNWGKIKDGATSVKKWVTDKFDGIVTFAKGLPGRITSAVSGTFDGIKSAFRSAINWIIGRWNSLSFSIPGVDTHIPKVGKVGGFTLSTPNIPLLDTGGVVRGPGLVRVGPIEEAMIPLSGPYARRSTGPRTNGAEMEAAMERAMSKALANAELKAEVRGDHLIFVIRQNRKMKGQRDPFAA